MFTPTAIISITQIVLGTYSGSTAGVTLRKVITVPAAITTYGGYLYIDGCGGGGGGGGGYALTTTGGGGGGGGGALGCMLMQNYLPPGTKTIYVQVGACGSGGAATFPGGKGDVTYVCRSGYEKDYLIRLPGGNGGSPGSLSGGGRGGDGAVTITYYSGYTRYIGGATAGASGNGVSLETLHARIAGEYMFGGGGGAGGNAGVLSGAGGSNHFTSGGNPATYYASGTTGSGGGGGSGCFSISSGYVGTCPTGNGGNGGDATGATGATTYVGTKPTASLGAGGGGGSGGYSGGAGTDGFLRLTFSLI